MEVFAMKELGLRDNHYETESKTINNLVTTALFDESNDGPKLICDAKMKAKNWDCKTARHGNQSGWPCHTIYASPAFWESSAFCQQHQCAGQ